MMLTSMGFRINKLFKNKISKFQRVGQTVKQGKQCGPLNFNVAEDQVDLLAIRSLIKVSVVALVKIFGHSVGDF